MEEKQNETRNYPNLPRAPCRLLITCAARSIRYPAGHRGIVRRRCISLSNMQAVGCWAGHPHVPVSLSVQCKAIHCWCAPSPIRQIALFKRRSLSLTGRLKPPKGVASYVPNEPNA